MDDIVFVQIIQTRGYVNGKPKFNVPRERGARCTQQLSFNQSNKGRKKEEERKRREREK